MVGIMVEGKLTVINKKNVIVRFITSRGKQANCNPKESQLSASLLEQKKKALTQLDGLEVEFEEVGGQPYKIREKGKDFEPYKNAQPTTQSPSRSKKVISTPLSLPIDIT